MQRKVRDCSAVIHFHPIVALMIPYPCFSMADATASCNFWSGVKAYKDAVEQLFDYLTWRQNYGVLLHFCRLKDMTIAVSEGQRGTTEHQSFTTRTLHAQSETRFTSRHTHPQDANKLVEIFHLFVDLSV